MAVLQARDVVNKQPIRFSSRFRTMAVAPAIGLLLIFVFSSLTIDYSGSAPIQRNWVFGPLDRDHTFGQTFVASPGDLVGIRVLLFANPTDRDDPVTLHLRYAEGDLPELAAVTLPLRSLDQRNWTTFDIQPLALNLTTTLHLDIEAPTLSPSDWITVIAGPDTYPNGELFADGTPRPKADLAFQPVYRRSWISGLLPISRMAQDKPGVLGWPPFYALLAYGCAISVAFLFSALWRTTQRG